MPQAECNLAEAISAGDLRTSGGAGNNSPENVIRVAKHLAQGLGYIHEHRYVHFDIKPKNIVRFGIIGGSDKLWKLIDFDAGKF